MSRQKMITLSPEELKEREAAFAAEAARLIKARQALNPPAATRWMTGEPSAEAMKVASENRDRDYVASVVNELRRRLARKDRNGKD